MRVGSRFGAAMAAALGLCLSAGPGRAAPAPPLEVYGKLPGVELMELSPSGELFATVATVGEQRRLIVATIKGQLLIASPVGDAKVRKLTWANDQHLLVVASATYDLRADFGFKYELDKVLDVDVQKKSAQIVFDKMLSVAKVVRGVFGAASSGGHDYGYFGAITFTRTIGGDFTFDHGWRDLYRVDLDSGSATLFANGDEQSSDWVLAADGSVAARAEYNEKSGRWRLFARDSVLGKPLVDRSSPRDDIELVGLGRAPGAVIITDNSGDRSTLEEVSLAGGDATRLLKDRSISRYWFDPQSRLFIGVESPADPGEVFFDPQLQARWELARKAFPRRKLRLQSYTSGLQRMIVKSEGDGDPGTYWLVDTLAKTANQLGEDRPEIPSDAVGQTSLISYKAADGLEIEAVLTLPPGRDPKKLPVVVMPHGGPIDVGDEVGFDWWAQAFASRGYAVLQPNYRGSSGRDVAFREAGYGEWGRKMPSDIADGLAALAARGVVDPKRACIVGASYGGYAALYGVTLQQGLYRCAVAYAGIGDLHRFLSQRVQQDGEKSSTVRYFRKVTGQDAGGDKAIKSISPAEFAEKADAPILLIHGKDDTVVPIDQSLQMASALKSAGKPYELVTLKGEDHWMSRQETRLATLKASVDFVQKNDPAD